MIVRELITKLGYKVDEKELKRYEEAAQKVGANMVRVGGQLTKFATLPIVAAGGFMVKLASDAAEAESKFNVVFRDVAEGARRSSEELRNSYGLSRKASMELLAGTGDLLSGFGFSGAAALDLSSQVNKLAVDLASFTNFSGGAKGASEALTKALLGERESVKSLGIAILEKDVQQEVARMQAQGQRFATERQAKAYATLNIALRQSKNAIGDFARTQNELANRTRILQGRLSDMAVEWGKLLLPAANAVVGVLIKVAGWLADLPAWVKWVVIAIAGLVAILGPLLVALGTVVSIVGWVIANAALIGTVLGVAAAGLGAILGFLLGIVAPAAIILLILQDIMTWLQGGESVFGTFVGPVEEFMDNVVFWIDRVKTGVANLWERVTRFFAMIAEGARRVPFLGKLLGGASVAASVAVAGQPAVTAQDVAASAALNGSTQTTTIQGGPITVEVPPGTPGQMAEDVGAAVDRAVRESLTRESRRVVNSSPVDD